MMAFTNRVKYIGTAGTGALILFLLWFATSPNFEIQASDDIYCMGNELDPCIVYFNITSKFYTYYFYNKEGLKLPFSENISDYFLGIDDKRYTGGFRRLDLISPYSAGSKYVLKLDKGKKRQFKLIVYKNNPEDTVKWGVGVANKELDPVLFGINITKLCDYKINFWNSTEWIKTNKTVWNSTTNKWNNITYLEKKIVNNNETVCNKIGYDINDKFKINLTKFPYDCEKNGKCLECVSLTDGAHLGKYVDCGSGKSCIKACLTTDGKINITEKNSEDEWSKVSKSYIAQRLEVEEI